MRSRPTACHVLSQVLAWVMLAMALLPAASRAWAAGQGDWVELCTSQGVRWVSVATGQVGEPDFKPMESPCAACLLHAQGMAPPPAPPVLALLPVLAEQPTAFLQAPSLPAVWRHSLSRGPPSRN